MDVLRQKRSSNHLTSQLAAQSEQLTLERHYANEPSSIPSDQALIALAKLSPEQESVVRMHTMEDLSFRDIAKVTGKSEVALRKIFERAKAKLRGFVAKDRHHEP